MDERTIVAALALTVVGSRLLHRRLRERTFSKLAGGQEDLPFGLAFEVEGKLSDLTAVARSGGIPWAPKAWLLRHELAGKRTVFETVSAFRKARRYFAVRQSGSKLKVVSVPATSDLVNLLTLGLMTAAVGIIGHTGWLFFMVVYAMLLADLASRLFLGKQTLALDIAKFLPVPKV